MKILNRFTSECIYETDKENLSGADLRGADLSDADLSLANLSGADLSDADLSGADLRGANLRDADLSLADLSDADLRGANLRDADLSLAALRGADLSDADLRDANLRDADLRDAKYKGLKSKRMTSINGIYKYTVIVLIDDTDTLFIGLGCKWGSEEYWKENFWNNTSEFPDDGSESTERRKIALETAIKVGNAMRIK